MTVSCNFYFRHAKILSMKSIFLLVCGVLLICGVQSCGYCTECVNYPKDTIKLCKKDFASEEAYTQTFRQLTYEGYDCQ